MIRVEYGAITIGAKEEFVPELLNCAEISNVDNLSKENLDFKNKCIIFVKNKKNLWNINLH